MYRMRFQHEADSNEPALPIVTQHPDHKNSQVRIQMNHRFTGAKSALGMTITEAHLLKLELIRLLMDDDLRTVQQLKDAGEHHTLAEMHDPPPY